MFHLGARLGLVHSEHIPAISRSKEGKVRFSGEITSVKEPTPIKSLKYHITLFEVHFSIIDHWRAENKDVVFTSDTSDGCRIKTTVNYRSYVVLGCTNNYLDQFLPINWQ